MENGKLADAVCVVAIPLPSEPIPLPSELTPSPGMV